MEATEKKQKLKKIYRTRRKAYFFGSLLFVLTLAALFVLSFDLADRPSFSESEKRDLTAFPKFSFSAVISGDYFENLSLWFADTFPFRDALVTASAKINSAIGVGQSIHHFSEETGDAIPEAESLSQNSVDVSVENPAQNSSDDLYQPALPAGTTQPPSPSQGDTGDTLEQTFGAVFIYGDTAYEYYNFVQNTADAYIQAVNAAADDAAKNGIHVYNMIIPTSIDITLNEKTRAKLNSSDQQNAITYMTSRMNSSVQPVSLFELLKAHKDEYIYFRTDHHWTSLGAYYAYAQFMSVKGADYEPLSRFTQYAFDGFLGSFYSDTGKNSALAQTPDIVYAYMPPYQTRFQMRQSGSHDDISWPLICDASGYSESYKYLCFIGGDNPVSVIENTEITDGETCVLVKESFGNAFAPYLACHYQYVYIIDYRYFDGDITDFAKEKGAADLIIQNNISMTRNTSLVKKLSETL